MLVAEPKVPVIRDAAEPMVRIHLPPAKSRANSGTDVEGRRQSIASIGLGMYCMVVVTAGCHRRYGEQSGPFSKRFAEPPRLD